MKKTKMRKIPLEVNDIFANKSRDIIQLELFLQNFIIKYSDILILINIKRKNTYKKSKKKRTINSHS